MRRPALLAPLRSSLFAPVLAAALGALLCASTASAGEPYVVLTDDGTIQDHAVKTLSDVKKIEAKLLELYAATGSEVPEVLSVWTTFPLAGSNVSTFFDPVSNDVAGIGLGPFYGGDGTFDSQVPPLRSVLLHNNVLKLQQRATTQRAPLEGFGEYLFLLELSHNWGPALKVPAPLPNTLVGFPFHWSFFMAAGGSPAGGNLWTDHMDGSFSVVAQQPGEVKFSPLDLYLMGLATPEEVPPFYVIESPVVPGMPTDPLWGGAFAAHSFPWFDQEGALTVTGTRRDLTAADIVSANGARTPAPGAKTSWTLGIVLLVSGSDDAAAVDGAKQTFAPLANALAPAFNTATSGKGTLTVVTDLPEGTGGSGGSGGAGGTGGGTGGGTTTTSAGAGGSGGAADDGGSCGCRAAGANDAGSAAWLALAAIGLGMQRRRKRSTAE